MLKMNRFTKAHSQAIERGAQRCTAALMLHTGVEPLEDAVLSHLSALTDESNVCTDGPIGFIFNDVLSVEGQISSVVSFI
ncbi:hypothetical protein KIPB_014563, partial [Kipferlia bialata]|eukprot:g14563.t1